MLQEAPRKVVVAGHWAGPGVSEGLSAPAALSRVAQGFAATAPPGWQVDVVPFGPGRALAEAVAASPGSGLAPVIVGVEEASTSRAGRQTQDALEAGLTPVVEGGHSIDVDAGLGLLTALSGVPLRLEPRSIDEGVPVALAGARERLARREVLAAASTARPLLGLDSVLALGVDLEPRPSQDREVTAALARAFRAGDSARLPGSGAAGGAAAVIHAVGGRIVDTGRLLSEVTALPARMVHADLVIVLEPLLHSPHLAGATLSAVTEAAAEQAVPVVAIAAESSLSAHEAAEWGIHGVLVTGTARRPEDALVDGGRRVARTWART